MSTTQSQVKRWSITSKKRFETVVAAIEAVVSRPNLAEFVSRLGAAKNYSELERIIGETVGSAGLVEFARFDLGAILRKESGQEAPKILRLLIGNPLIMMEMVKRAPEAGSYAPVTILIHERADGVHLTYDEMVGFIASCAALDALAIARALDEKVEGMLTAAAA